MTALATVEFWDSFHRREVAGPTEWYLPLDVVVREVLSICDKIRSKKRQRWGSSVGDTEDVNLGEYPRVLHPGCGSSTVGVVLQREHGFSVVNADFVSEEVLDTLRGRYPGCNFVHSDARSTSFPDRAFDLVIDKGLFDSVTAGTDGRADTAKAFLGEAARVLSPGGKYMLFSVFNNDGLGHKDMRNMLAHPEFNEGLETRVLDTPPFEYPDQESSFLYILTKTDLSSDTETNQPGGNSMRRRLEATATVEAYALETNVIAPDQQSERRTPDEHTHTDHGIRLCSVCIGFAGAVPRVAI